MKYKYCKECGRYESNPDINFAGQLICPVCGSVLVDDDIVLNTV